MLSCEDDVPPEILREYHCAKSVRIRSYSSPYFPAYGLNMRENIDQSNSEYGHLLRSVYCH